MSQSQRTVLIVDDSPEDQELYRRYLLRDQEYSYIFLEAELGRQGLELWQQHHPDIVLLDYRLPDLDGLEFLAQLPTQQSFIPVIVMTGQGNEAIAVQAIKAGAQDYLVKGEATAKTLQLAVNGAIESMQLRSQLQQRIEAERLIAQISQQIHQSLNLELILQTTVTEVRQFLDTDRVIVFNLQPDGNGTVVAESVKAEWQALLSSTIYDHCLAENYSQPYRPQLGTDDPYFNQNYVERYRQGLVTAKSDIYDGSIDPCHLELLVQLQVRANLIVPILHEDRFWGLLIAHHCNAPRVWQSLEIDLLKQLATQVSIALRQAELYQQAQQEIAERQRAEAQLQLSQERLQLALEAARMGTWEWNIQTGQIQWSDNLVALFGLKPGEFEGSFEMFVSRLFPEDRDRVLSAIDAAVTTGANYDIEFRVVYPNGDLRWAMSQGKVFYDQSGQPLRMAGIDLDITSRKQAEEVLQQILELEQAARGEAERANRIKDEFLAILSHELRSPLTPILGWAQLLQTHKFDETKTAQGLATIQRNANLQALLIDDLLDVAKILRGKLSLNATPLNLVLVIESALDTVRTAAVAKSISLAPSLPNIGQVSGDATRLQQIVWNLLANAIKFTPKGGRVDIRLERIDNLAQITVIDSGKGIHPEFLPHIFKYFRQEDVSITRKHGGLGLGLAIVHHLVEAHGGTISADSPGEGQGATFTVRLPLLNVEPETEQTNELLNRESALTGIRVLCIDDEPDIRELLNVLLTQYGASVITVASAANVLTALEAFQPDILISDIGMPEVDGYTLLQQVRSLPPEKGGQILAIALTAYAGEIDQQRALSVGFQQHLAKPIKPDRLIQAVLALLDR